MWAYPGRNRISVAQTLVYLRQFKHLRMLTLEDNPLAQSSDYRSRAVAHLPNLTFLDHRLVSSSEVQAATEQHQVTFL
jgi:hypothetical protein